MGMDDSERLARFEAVLAALLAEQESVGATLEACGPKARRARPPTSS
mgnify:CR=1 FL=1